MSRAAAARRAPTLVTDGRVRRSQRSGQAIVEALIDLVREGILAPTAQQVAARAQVGLRTVFRRFSDMDGLLADVGARVQAEALPLLLGAEPHGSRRERTLALIRQRVEFFERIAPFKRSANVKRWRSAFLRQGHVQLVRGLRSELLRWLPELEHAADDLVDAIDLATSFEAWDRLRSDQGLPRARAQAAVERSVLALVKEIHS